MAEFEISDELERVAKEALSRLDLSPGGIVQLGDKGFPDYCVVKARKGEGFLKCQERLRDEEKMDVFLGVEIKEGVQRAFLCQRTIPQGGES